VAAYKTLNAIAQNIAELLIVDVLIPTYNESNEIICTTITAATQMENSQDRLRVHICDDGGTLYKNAVSPIQWQRPGCAIIS
jgi:cellulose synthase (UDP-forming)